MTSTRAWFACSACLAVTTLSGGAWAGNVVATSTSADASASVGFPGLPNLTPAGSFGQLGTLLASDAPSRDALFGESRSGPREAPVGESKSGSREGLFGSDPEPDKKATRLSGFVDGSGAYTYGRPRHWSRGVARLQLSAQGELADGVKWKVGGRADGDLVHATSNFFPGAVRRDQRLDFFHGENYLDFSVADWDFRVGAQQIVWGEVVGLFFADVVSARDMREFLLPGFDVIRIPQWAARAEYTAGNAHVELIAVPIPTFDRIGKPGSEFYPVPLASPLPPEVEGVFRDPDKPGRSLRNGSYGARANTLVSGWDISAFYYRSHATAPTFYRLPSNVPGQAFVVQPRHDRIWQLGGTISKDLGDFVLRGEAVYTHGQNFSVADLTAVQSVLGRQTLDYVVSAEWSLPEDTRLNVQAFQRHYFGGGADVLAIPNDGFGGSVLIARKFGPYEPQFLWIRNFGDGGSLLRPRLTWSAAPNVTVGFGADIFTGAADTFFGRYNNRDRMYVDVRMSF